MKVVKKILIGVLILFVLVIALVACIDGEEESPELTAEQIEQIENGENAVMYKGMLDNLDEAFAKKTETLINEFKAESIYIAGDQEALKELGDSKVKELAEMCTRNKEMLETQVNDHGDSDEVYQYWAEQLDDIYKNYAVQVMALYE